MSTVLNAPTPDLGQIWDGAKVWRQLDEVRIVGVMPCRFVPPCDRHFVFDSDCGTGSLCIGAFARMDYIGAAPDRSDEEILTARHLKRCPR